MPHYGIPDYGIPHYGIPHYGIPHYGMPHYGIPHYGIPHYGMPHYGIPDYGIPHYGIPHYGIPHYGMPHYVIPHYGIPDYGIPHYGIPHYGIPHYGISHYGIPHYGIPHYVIPHYVIPQYGIPHYVIPHYGIPHYGIPHYGIPHYGIPHYVIPHYGIPHYVIPHYGIPHYVIPHYGIPHYGIPHYVIAHYGIPHYGIPHYVIPHYGIPHYVIPHYGIPHYVIPHYGIPHYVIPHYGIPHYVIPHYGIPHYVIPHYGIPHYVIPHYGIPHYVIPHYGIPHYVIPHYGIPHYVIPHYGIPHYGIPHYVIPHYGIPHYVIPHYVIPHYGIPHYVIPHYVIPHYRIPHYGIPNYGKPHYGIPHYGIPHYGIPHYVLLKDGIIEHSRSPWRAQVLVVRSEAHRRRMVIDYSQTINRFTQLDAYPLPGMDALVRQVALYSVYSTLDLRSAYHQVPISRADRVSTAFESGQRLYQFTRLPFGVTNGVACFQRAMDDLVAKENLTDVFVYLDNLTVCGYDQEHHDANLKRFLKVARKYRLTMNAANDRASLKRALGLFAHYSKWVQNFSAKLRPFMACDTFPMGPAALAAFAGLKADIAGAAVATIDESASFVLESDASDHAIAATLSQGGRPVAFFSRTLTSAEQRHSSVEKEAYAIVESIRRWRPYLLGRSFQIVTDQQSVAFMYDTLHAQRIKNEKITQPLPMSSNSRYLLTIVDEYCRFPFAYTCGDMSAATVIRCLQNLFSMFGYPAYVHTDRGAVFLSQEVRGYLLQHNVASSYTTPYRPQANGQIERFTDGRESTVSVRHLPPSLIPDWWLALTVSFFAALIRSRPDLPGLHRVNLRQKAKGSPKRRKVA
uniref:uncharacterized protein n=1 Tax=Myxine glutinosa TaxID=7769 RepID=UPI00358E67D9